MDKTASRLRRARQTRAKIAELKVNRLSVHRTNLHPQCIPLQPLQLLQPLQSLPCIVPGCPSLHQDNAHIEGDGAGRKANADKIVPLCRGHHRTRKDSLHNLGREEFEGTFYVDLAALALDTERTWRRYAGHSPTHDGARER